MIRGRYPIFLCFAVAFTAIADDRIDFNRDVRPLISGSCIACHGPDAEERKAGMRLDTAEGARADNDGVFAIVPGKPMSSEAFLRIISDDEDERMPPEGKGRKFTKAEADVIRKWIEQGAEYDVHWAYKVPETPKVPAVTAANFPIQNPIDAFVLKKQKEVGLSPSPQADRLTLARRVAIDLTGLPPTPTEADAFVADKRPDAYERFVDAQLAKPGYGERWARTWLDLARYADSAGYADDPGRTIWAYRDWVIRAFNANQPFDEFTIDQIAGDLRDNPTEEQLVATAFHRNTLTNNEGGTNNEEFRNVAVVDRVNTTMEVWMGTTMACAQCHTHKYDPITHHEYFQLFDFFNQSEDADRRNEAPLHEVWTVEQQANKTKWQARLESLRQELKKDTPAIAAHRENWLTEVQRPPKWRTPTFAAAKGADLIYELTEGQFSLNGERPNKATYELHFLTKPGMMTALRLQVPAKQKHNFVLSQVKATFTPTGSSETQSLKFDRVVADYVNSRFSAEAVLAGKVNANRGWSIGGATGKPHELALFLKQPLQLTDGMLVIELVQESRHSKHVLTHFGLELTGDAHAYDFVRLPADLRNDLRDGEASAKDLERLTQEHPRFAPQLAPQRQEIAKLEKNLKDARPHTTVPIMKDLPKDKYRKSHVQIRGNYKSLGDQVTMGTPVALHPLRDDLPKNRLALAHWLVDDQNPLTARVIVNRFWADVFGTGIVTTLEEFGAQGELPTHPELLDWLAVDFQKDWDVKRLLKQLAMSATYRQQSVVTPEALEADPANRYLARGPRFRVSAEMIRDQALFAGGLLSDKMFGPPVKPPQPNLGLKAAFGSGTDWKTSSGEDKFRRGLYTTWRRSSPYPSMAAFDAPNREVCTSRRGRTNTPLQALVTLNDPVYVEAAQALARRMAAVEGPPEEQLALGFRAVVIRAPKPAETQELLALFSGARGDYGGKPELAKAMAEDPIGPLPAKADPATYAAWTVVANVLLNLDETFLKR